MSLYYISENGIVSSNFLSESESSWEQDQQFGNYSTAVDTRSLSISLFPMANSSSNLNIGENSTTNIALLFYETPNGKVSALLHRLIIIVNENPQAGSSPQDQWINITSQESKALPNEFRNAPKFNYRNTPYEGDPLLGDGHNPTFSHTLYEADPIAVYSTPFFSALNPNGSLGANCAMFYSPFNLPLNATSPLAGDSFITATYEIGLNGSGNFSLVGSHYATPYTECLL